VSSKASGSWGAYKDPGEAGWFQGPSTVIVFTTAPANRCWRAAVVDFRPGTGLVAGGSATLWLFCAKRSQRDGLLSRPSWSSVGGSRKRDRGAQVGRSTAVSRDRYRGVRSASRRPCPGSGSCQPSRGRSTAASRDPYRGVRSASRRPCPGSGSCGKSRAPWMSRCWSSRRAQVPRSTESPRRGS